MEATGTVVAMATTGTGTATMGTATTVTAEPTSRNGLDEVHNSVGEALFTQDDAELAARDDLFENLELAQAHERRVLGQELCRVRLAAKCGSLLTASEIRTRADRPGRPSPTGPVVETLKASRSSRSSVDRGGLWTGVEPATPR